MPHPPPSNPTLKVSARNQFDAVISALVPGPVNTEVSLRLPGGERLVAVITQASAKELGLAVGGRAWAIVKAPWVIVTTGGRERQVPACNHFEGIVSAVKTGPINAAVTLTLPGGTQVHAVLTQEAVNELGLAPGVIATAVIKPSQVMLAA